MGKLKLLYLPPAALSADILSDRAVQLLQSLGDVTWNELGRDLSPDELKAWLPGADAVVTSWGSPAFTADAMGVADKLRIVGHAAGTIKHMVSDEFWDKGAVVLSAAPEIAYSVAEYVIWAMLTMQRDLVRFDRKMKSGTPWRSAGDSWGHELLHRKVGVVAASFVGRAVIAQLHAFHCDVSVYDPYLSDEAAKALGA
ncbi:MAG: hydroxyacid dehydrogenase, partial [Chloroflexi bacterium]|nr:hydroxyacid dehydrogenase [Chloroflexota bacterium]